MTAREPDPVVSERVGPSRGVTLAALLDLVEAAMMGDSLEVGRAQARDAAELVDDVVLLQRVAAGLATAVAFGLATPDGPPRSSDEVRRRMRFLRTWVTAQRLEALWMDSP